MSFLTPAWLLGLVLLPALLVWPQRVRGAQAGTLGTALLRMLALACLFVALARPTSLVDDERETHVLVVDRSASIDAAAAASLDEAAAAIEDAWSERGP
ncbi:MAG: hypothetical protein P1V81_08415, partial [Planctomycetota bacterium]|nr:hypothetical protein [Planctomycetota bacterium]